MSADTALAIGHRAKLIDPWYGYVATVTVFDPIPETIEHDGHTFTFYAQTYVIGNEPPLLYRCESNKWP